MLISFFSSLHGHKCTSIKTSIIHEETIMNFYFIYIYIYGDTLAMLLIVQNSAILNPSRQYIRHFRHFHFVAIKIHISITPIVVLTRHAPESERVNITLA